MAITLINIPKRFEKEHKGKTLIDFLGSNKKYYAINKNTNQCAKSFWFETIEYFHDTKQLRIKKNGTDEKTYLVSYFKNYLEIYQWENEFDLLHLKLKDK